MPDLPRQPRSLSRGERQGCLHTQAAMLRSNEQARRPGRAPRHSSLEQREQRTSRCSPHSPTPTSGAILAVGAGGMQANSAVGVARSTAD
jgi:hypothetical protein